jgi:hypothetical protein
MGRSRKRDPLTKFVTDRATESPAFWTEFRRASRKVPEALQEAMTELADSGSCQIDEKQAVELRRILSTLVQPASPLITELPYVRPQFWR